MIAPDTLTIPVNLTGDDADAGYRDGEAAALALAVRVTKQVDPTYATSFALGAMSMFAAVLADVSRPAIANILADLGASYRAAAKADAQAVRH